MYLRSIRQILSRKVRAFFFSIFARSSGVNGCLAHEFVERSRCPREADTKFDVGIQLRHGCRQKMRGGVAKNEKGIGIFVR